MDAKSFEGGRTLLVAPGLTTQNKLLGTRGITTSNKKLLVAPDSWHYYSEQTTRTLLGCRPLLVGWDYIVNTGKDVPTCFEG